MTTAKLSALIGQSITLRDARTGVAYSAPILDAKASYGNLRLTCYGSTWFEPTTHELESIGRTLEVQTK